LKRILILAYDFPPFNSIGSQRPYGWLLSFASFGLYPVVVTRHWDEGAVNEVDCFKPSSEQSVTIEENEQGTIIRVPFNPGIRDKMLLKYGNKRFKKIRKALTFTSSILRFVLFRFDNTKEIYFEALKYIRENKCDYIIATGEPFILFRYASLLSKRFGIKWFADYRDGWSTNLMIRYNPSVNQKIFGSINRFFEKRISSTAEFLTATSDYSAKEISKVITSRPIHKITNGFAEDDYSELQNIEQPEDEFIISYMGSIYPYQPLELFLEAAEEFINLKSAENIKLIFYGAEFNKGQEQRIKGFSDKLNKYILTTQRLPRKNLFSELKKSHILLLLASDEVDSSCAKVFEYLPLGRKILLVKNDNGFLEKMVKDCNSGDACSSKNEIIDILSESYNEFLRTGKLVQESKNYDIYRRREQTHKLAKLILEN